MTLIPTGPLTNVALLLRRHPELVDRIEQIVLMGGTMGEGNTTPLAEFNIVVDPEAADVVVRSGIPVTLCGLDVTHQALATPDVVARIARARHAARARGRRSARASSASATARCGASRRRRCTTRSRSRG